MRQTIKSIILLVAILIGGAGQTWAGSTADLGSIKTGTVTNGTLKFYQEDDCVNEIAINEELYSGNLTEGKVYIKAMPGSNYTGVGVTFTAQVSISSSSLEARAITRGSTSDLDIGQAITVSPISGKPGVYSFTMPDDGKNVTISATFPAKTKANVSYIDIDGQTKQAEAYELDGTETTLGEPGGTSSSPKETWYVCNTNLSYTTFNFSSYCNVNIILADNVEMSVINSNGDAISNSNDSSPDSQASFGVYGQSKGSDRGTLTAKSTSSIENAINITGGVIISHCKLTAVGGNFGIRAQGSGEDVTISGAEVKATGTSYCAICCDKGGVSITGGIVIADGTTGITSSDDIVLGWTDANDYIKASSYSVGSNKAVKTADGQRFVAYTPGATESDPMIATAVISGTVIDPTTLNGKTLKPLDGYTINVADNISLMDGTTAKTPDFTIGTTPYYIYKASTEEDPVTVTLSYSGTDIVTLGGLPEGTTLDAVENQPLQRSFAMPAKDVALTATAVTGLTASGDTYDYDGTAKTPTVKLGDDVFAATNYIVAYTKGGSAVSEAKKVGTYSCTVNGSGSYIGTIATDVAITINPKTVTVSGITASNKTYDGKTTATLNYNNATISGKVTGDKLSVSATGTFANKNAGNNKTVSISNITLGGTDKGNYTLATTSATTTANISKKALTVTADDKSVSYGDAAPTYTASYSGFVSGESKNNLSGSLGFSCSYTSSSNTGSYTIKPSGLSSSNYNISYTNGTLTVGAKNVSYTGGTITQDQNGYTVNLTEGTGSANPLPSGTIDDLDYSRTLTAPGTGEGDVEIGGEAANLYTVCLPTTPTTGTGATYYTLSGVEGNTLKFIEIDGSPAAFTPYLVAVKGSSNFTESCNDVRFDTEHEISGTTVDGFTFTGTLTGLSNAAAIAAASSGNVTYILQNAAKWGKVVSGSVHLPPFRAYIVGPGLAAGARELSSSIGDGNATAIERIVTTDRDGTEHWYDMNGRRIEKPTTKGVYILNGRKEVIK